MLLKKVSVRTCTRIERQPVSTVRLEPVCQLDISLEIFFYRYKRVLLHHKWKHWLPKSDIYFLNFTIKKINPFVWKNSMTFKYLIWLLIVKWKYTRNMKRCLIRYQVYAICMNLTCQRIEMLRFHRHWFVKVDREFSDMSTFDNFVLLIRIFPFNFKWQLTLSLWMNVIYWYILI